LVSEKQGVEDRIEAEYGIAGKATLCRWVLPETRRELPLDTVRSSLNAISRCCHTFDPASLLSITLSTQSGKALDDRSEFDMTPESLDDMEAIDYKRQQGSGCRRSKTQAVMSDSWAGRVIELGRGERGGSFKKYGGREEAEP
jgi:hypothetical protein